MMSGAMVPSCVAVAGSLQSQRAVPQRVVPARSLWLQAMSPAPATTASCADEVTSTQMFVYLRFVAEKVTRVRRLETPETETLKVSGYSAYEPVRACAVPVPTRVAPS